MQQQGAQQPSQEANVFSTAAPVGGPPTAQSHSSGPQAKKTRVVEGDSPITGMTGPSRTTPSNPPLSSQMATLPVHPASGEEEEGTPFAQPTSMPDQHKEVRSDAYEELDLAEAIRRSTTSADGLDPLGGEGAPQNTSSKPPQLSQKAAPLVHTASGEEEEEEPALIANVAGPEPPRLYADLIKLLHEKLGTPEVKIESALAELREDGSWIKETRHVKDVLEAKTPNLAIGDLADVFDFDHMVKAAHDVLAQVFNDPKHNRAVLYGYKGQGKTQTLHFVMKLLQKVDELVVLLDERSIMSGTPLLAQPSVRHWSDPLKRISKAKITKMLKASADASSKSKDLTSSDKTIANANSTDATIEASRGKALGEFENDYDIAEEAFRIAESAKVTPNVPNLLEIAMKTAKQVKSMEESFMELASRPVFEQPDPYINEAAVIAALAMEFARRILATASKDNVLEAPEQRVIRTFPKLVAQLYLLAATLYRFDAQADVVLVSWNEAADAVCEIAQQLSESSQKVEDIRKIAAHAYQVGENAMHQDALEIAAMSFKLAAKFYKALASPNEGLTATNKMTADAYELASIWYGCVAKKLGVLFGSVADGLSRKPLLEDLSIIVADESYRVWILVDNLTKWENPGVLHHRLFPKEGEPSRFHFIVTGGVGMGKWTSERGLEESVVDLPFLSKDAGWRLATNLEHKLSASDLKQHLVDYGEPADHIESKFGGVPGYIVDLVLKYKQGGGIDDRLSKLQRDLTELLEKGFPIPQTFAETCLTALRTPDRWRFLRRADLCGRLPPRGAIAKMILEWLVSFGKPNPSEVLTRFRTMFCKNASIDGHVLEMLELIKMEDFQPIDTYKLELVGGKWETQKDVRLLGEPGMLCYFDDEVVEVTEKVLKWYVVKVPDCFPVADAVILMKVQKSLSLYWIQITRSPEPFDHKTHLNCSPEANGRLEVCRKAILSEFGLEKFESETYVMIAPNCLPGKHVPSGDHTEPYLFSPMDKVPAEAVKARTQKGSGCCRCTAGDCKGCACKAKGGCTSCASKNCTNKVAGLTS